YDGLSSDVRGTAVLSTGLFDRVVGCFLGDRDVVGVGFPEAGSRDAHELSLGAELVDRLRAAVAHAGAEAADELVDEFAEAALEGDHAFDAFGDELGLVLDRALAVALLRAAHHGAFGAHAAVDLVAAALVDHGLAGAFLAAGEEAPDHDARRAGGDCLGDVARVADASVGDHRDARGARDARDVGDRGDLRHADARDDAGGADRPGADADLHAVRARRDQI